MVSGTLPADARPRRRARPPGWTCVFWRKKPVALDQRLDPRRVGGGQRLRASGSAANSAGVTRFTILSVHWADRMVATTSSHGERWSSSHQASGYALAECRGRWPGPASRAPCGSRARRSAPPRAGPRRTASDVGPRRRRAASSGAPAEPLAPSAPPPRRRPRRRLPGRRARAACDVAARPRASRRARPRPPPPPPRADRAAPGAPARRAHDRFATTPSTAVEAPAVATGEMVDDVARHPVPVASRPPRRPGSPAASSRREAAGRRSASARCGARRRRARGVRRPGRRPRRRSADRW